MDERGRKPEEENGGVSFEICFFLDFFFFFFIFALERTRIEILEDIRGRNEEVDLLRFGLDRLI